MNVFTKILNDFSCMNEKLKNERLDATLAKGIGIVLVVIGHILAKKTAVGNEWFSELVRCIYLFHMPFLMFISGFLFFRSGRLERIISEYPEYIKKQAVRLLLPFLFIGFIIVLGKFGALNIVYVDNIPTNFFQGLINIIWHTKDSASFFLWYIYVLFIYGVVSPVLYKIFGARLLPLFIIGAGLFFVPPIHYFYLDQITTFFIFFVIGGVVRNNEKKFLSIITINGIYIPLVYLFFSSFLLLEWPNIDKRYLLLFTGLLSIPVIYRWCFVFKDSHENLVAFVMLMGRKSYIIYLLNTICIGVSKAVIFSVSNWNYYNFFWVAPILICSGLMGPIIGEWLVFRRVPFIKKHIL